VCSARMSKDQTTKRSTDATSLDRDEQHCRLLPAAAKATSDSKIKIFLSSSSHTQDPLLLACSDRTSGNPQNAAGNASVRLGFPYQIPTRWRPPPSPGISDLSPTHRRATSHARVDEESADAVMTSAPAPAPAARYCP
jgi:hypothetical protein